MRYWGWTRKGPLTSRLSPLLMQSRAKKLPINGEISLSVSLRGEDAQVGQEEEEPTLAPLRPLPLLLRALLYHYRHQWRNHEKPRRRRWPAFEFEFEFKFKFQPFFSPYLSHLQRVVDSSSFRCVLVSWNSWGRSATRSILGDRSLNVAVKCDFEFLLFSFMYTIIVSYRTSSKRSKCLFLVMVPDHALTLWHCSVCLGACDFWTKEMAIEICSWAYYFGFDTLILLLSKLFLIIQQSRWTMNYMW